MQEALLTALTTALTLAAQNSFLLIAVLIIAILLFYYLRNERQKQQIESMPQKDRLEMISRADDAVHVDITRLSAQQQFVLTNRLLTYRAATKNAVHAGILIGFLATLAAVVTIVLKDGTHMTETQASSEQPLLSVAVKDKAVITLRRDDSTREVGRIRESRWPERGAPREPDVRMFAFTQPLASPPNSLPLEVVRMEGKEQALYRVDVDLSRTKGSDATGALPELATGKFLRLGAREQRTVIAVVPSSRCSESSTGWALAEGAKLFSSEKRERPPRIVVRTKKDSGKPDDAFDAVNSKDESRTPIVAVIGSYNSSCTEAILRSCKDTCGPILTFSSSVGLLQQPSESTGRPPTVFRMTTSNALRADDTVALILSAIDASSEESSAIYVAYAEDGMPSTYFAPNVSYARDQAAQFARALRANGLHKKTRWIRYKRPPDGEATQRSTALERGELDVWEGNSFEESLDGDAAAHGETWNDLVRRMLRGPARKQFLVLIDLDEPVLAFGRALNTWRAQNTTSRRTVQWYVPGPREIFEGLRKGACGDALGDAERSALADAQMVVPDDNSASVQRRDFQKLWRGAHGRNTVAPASAARMYDALTALDRAVQAVEDGFRAEDPKLVLIDADAYRARLRSKLAEARFSGASGTLAFHEDGELLGRNYIMEFAEGRLRPFTR